jgi:glutaredoxin
MFAFRLMLFCIAFATVLPCSAQTTYRWTDKTGKTVFSDQPPPPEIQAIETKGGQRTEGPPPQIPYATSQAAGKYPVTLYTTASCTDACVRARALLNGRGVPFSEKLLTSQEEFAEVAKQMGNESFIPGLKVGSQNFPGLEIASWNNLLDLAGYPKTAPYGSKPSGIFSQ